MVLVEYDDIVRHSVDFLLSPSYCCSKGERLMSIIAYILGMLGVMLIGFSIHFAGTAGIDFFPVFMTGIVMVFIGLAGCIYTEVERVR